MHSTLSRCPSRKFYYSDFTQHSLVLVGNTFADGNSCIDVATSNPEVWSDISFPNDVVKNELLSYISKRLTPQPTKIRSDIEVTCFEYDGIDAVKTALRAAEARNTAENQVKVRLVSPPLYVLTLQSLDKSAGIAHLEESINVIDSIISKSAGSCVVRMTPRAVTETDDAALRELMAKRERENLEVSGDEDASESDENPVSEII